MIGGLLAACILFSGLWGWYSGALKVMLKLGVLALAYGLTFRLTPALAHHLTAQGWLTGVYVWPCAAVALFVGSLLLLSLSARFCLYLAPDDWHHSGKPVGALAGLLLGTVLGFSLVWTVGVLQDAHQQRQATKAPTPAATTAATQPAAATPPVTTHARTPLDQALYDLAADVMVNSVTAALPTTPDTQLAQAMLKSPIAVGEGFKQLASNPDLRQLLSDPASRHLLIQGDIERIRQLPAFQQLTQDRALMDFLKTGGLTGDTDTQIEQDLATKLARYTRNFDIIRQTQEYQVLQQDQDFQNKLHAGQWLELLGDERVRQLTELLINPPAELEHQLSASLPDAIKPAATFRISSPADTHWQSRTDTNAGSTPAAPEAGGVIYRWKDETGKIHLTDTPPPDGTDYDTFAH